MKPISFEKISRHSMAILVVVLTLAWLSYKIVSIVFDLDRYSTELSTKSVHAVKTLGDINTQMTRLRALENQLLLENDEPKPYSVIEKMQGIKNTLRANLHTYHDLTTTAQEAALFEQLQTHYQQYLSIQTMRIASPDWSLSEEKQWQISSTQAYHAVTHTVATLITYYDNNATEAAEYGHQIYLQMKNIAHAVILGALLISALTVYLVAKEYKNGKKAIEKRVLKALKTNQFRCVYQPIVDLETGKIAGAEVLSRLSDQYGDIYPDQFIPVISAHNKTWAFTQNMIQNALRELQGVETIDQNFKLSFNIFPCDINNGHLCQLLSLPETKQFAGIIALEITESEELDYNAAKKHLNKLSQSGFQLAIDDFGTGYSNFSELEFISADYLKIDRSFVIDMEQSSIKSILISHILPIAQDLNMKVIAEGVENLQQQALLKQLGVDFGQGWALGKPAPIANFKAQLSTDWHSALPQPSLKVV